VTTLKEPATPVPREVIPAQAGIQRLSQQRKNPAPAGFFLFGRRFGFTSKVRPTT
jgi:hypothetical protein